MNIYYRLIALEQAGKLPNHTSQELLQNADKIEGWLNKGKGEIDFAKIWADIEVKKTEK